MLINMAVEGNVNVRNLVQIGVLRLALWETINFILTATYQEILTYIVLIVSAKIPELEGSICPSSYNRKLPNY